MKENDNAPKHYELAKHGVLDDSNFNCEVGEHDDSQVLAHKSDLSDNYSMPQRVTLDEVKQVQAQMLRKGSQNSTSNMNETGSSIVQSSVGPSPTREQARMSIFGDQAEFQQLGSPPATQNLFKDGINLDRKSEAKSGFEASNAKQGLQNSVIQRKR